MNSHQQIHAVTHIGEVRQTNQDCLYVDGWATQRSGSSLSHHHDSESPVLIAVIDGMGGHPGGELASWIAARGLADLNVAGSESLENLNNRIQTLSDIVQSVGAATRGFSHMGATIAGMLLTSANTALLFNVGDCSILRLRDGYLSELAIIDRASGDAENTRRSRVTQCLAGTTTPTAIDAHVEEINVNGGDVFVLCTDGLTDSLIHEDIVDIIRGMDSPQEMAHALLSTALERGATDNVSLIVLKPDGNRDRPSNCLDC